MHNALPVKQKLGFLDGTVRKPDDGAKEIEDWWSVNSKLVAWTFQSIEPSLLSSVTYYDIVKEL